jgi:hypothetical protein
MSLTHLRSAFGISFSKTRESTPFLGCPSRGCRRSLDLGYAARILVPRVLFLLSKPALTQCFNCRISFVGCLPGEAASLTLRIGSGYCDRFSRWLPLPFRIFPETGGVPFFDCGSVLSASPIWGRRCQQPNCCKQNAEMLHIHHWLLRLLIFGSQRIADPEGLTRATAKNQQDKSNRYCTYRSGFSIAEQGGSGTR